MSQRTQAELVAEIGFRLGLDVSSGSDGEVSVIDALDDAQRRVWNAKKWKERRGSAFVPTFTPYSTGTVAIALGGTALTGTTTVWTAAMSGRKFALALGSPHYVFTYVSGTSGTVAQAYAEATQTASPHVIFSDEFDVATDVGSIARISLERPEWGGRMEPVEESALDGSAFVHGASGQPKFWCRTNSTTVGTYRIRVWPIPDGVYRMRIRYWKTCTDLTSPGAVSSLGEDKDRLLLYAAMLEAQTLPGATQITNEDQVTGMIDRAWTEQDESALIQFRTRRLDQSGGMDAIWLDGENSMAGFI